MNFIDKKISVKRAIAILAKNGIQVDDDDAAVILDFLYLMAKNYKRPEQDQNAETPRRKSNFGKNVVKLP